MTRHYFVLLSVDSAADFRFARDLRVRNHLNLLHNHLILQNLLRQRLSLTTSCWLSAIFRLTTCLEWSVQIATTVEVCSLENDQVVGLILLVQTAAVLFEGLWAALRVHCISFLFLRWRVLKLIPIIARLASVGRLGDVSAWNETPVYRSGGLVALWVFFMHHLVRQINNFHALATCAGRRLLDLTNLS